MRNNYGRDTLTVADEELQDEANEAAALEASGASGYQDPSSFDPESFCVGGLVGAAIASAVWFIGLLVGLGCNMGTWSCS